MGWIQKLYETYENCEVQVGVIDGNKDKVPLLPIAHSTQNAHIEVVLNGKAEFLRARILEKDESMTIIPVTEDSASRSSGIAPHPLCDKLVYVAGDFCTYVKKKNGEDYHYKYIEQLGAWCNSPFANRKVNIILSYLTKGKLISDLVKHKILVCDDKGMLDAKVKLGVGQQSDAFIRFMVEIPDDNVSAVWLDPKIYRSYVDFILSSQKEKELCYVKGEEIPCAEKHSAKIRNSADKGKLISSNDESGFTYRGRFENKRQVMNVGYEISQKAHNVLRWLIDRQGYKNGEQVIVAWGTRNEAIPNPLDDTFDILFGQPEKHVSTDLDFAKRLNQALAGYGYNLDITSEIIILGLDSATTGRLSISYYRELGGVDFLNRLEKWHSTCVWKHSYKQIKDGLDERGKIKFKYITYTGAPSPKDIAIAAYGKRISDKLKKTTVERLLPCIVDGSRMPYDLVNSAVNNISNPVGMDKWEWEKSLTITCALVKKYRYDKFKEVWDMSLDENQKGRSYIFGRLLAIAQQIEEWALSTTGEKRSTNAERLMHQFKLHPYKTWGIITDKLNPYLARLGPKATSLVELMTRVNSMLTYEDFTSMRKLDDSYILGYYCQRQVFIEEKYRRIAESETKKIKSVK